ncbi:MAG: hypothetical protein AB8B63_12495 [Granulosicoccus sp.]
MESTKRAFVFRPNLPARFSESPIIPACFAILVATSNPTGKRHLSFRQLTLPHLRNAVLGGSQSVLLMLTLLLTLTASGHSMAGKADVINASVVLLSDGRYRIDATVKHADTGWEHYANRWEVLAEDGSVLGLRELAHPHVNEQPFTRSLTLSLPAGITRVTLRANDSVHGLGGQSFELTIPVP